MFDGCLVLKQCNVKTKKDKTPSRELHLGYLEQSHLSRRRQSHPQV